MKLADLLGKFQRFFPWPLPLLNFLDPFLQLVYSRTSFVWTTSTNNIHYWTFFGYEGTGLLLQILLSLKMKKMKYKNWNCVCQTSVWYLIRLFVYIIVSKPGNYIDLSLISQKFSCSCAWLTEKMSISKHDYYWDRGRLELPSNISEINLLCACEAFLDPPQTSSCNPIHWFFSSLIVFRI